MAGQFSVDIPRLQAAVKKLEDARVQLDNLVGGSSRLKVGELTAGDGITRYAVEELQKRAVGPQGSLQIASQQLADVLNHKIDAYKASIAEYQRAEEHSTLDHRHIDPS